MGITVDELLADPFVNRTRLVKETIVLEGKPRPALENLVSEVISGGNNSANANAGKLVMIFDVASYDHIDWLTGCSVRQSLFCWPCLLFRTQKCTWNTTGIKDLCNLRVIINAHEKCMSHIQALLDLQIFASKIEAPVPAPKQDREAFLKKNRDIAERIIEAVCHLTAQVRHLDKSMLEIEDCIQTLRFIRDYDILKSNQIGETIEKLQREPNILTDVIKAITSTVKASISTEVDKASFVSVILSEHSTDRAKSHLSAILRYLKCGEVCERFVGFKSTDVIYTPRFLLRHIEWIIKEFQIAHKVVAISFDGSSSYFGEALMLLKVDVRNAHFIPCHFHNLESVLQESLCSIKECDLFFKNLTVLKSCFQFLAPADTDTPILDSLRSGSLAEFLHAVKNYRVTITNLLDTLSSDHKKLTKRDLGKMNSLRSFLTDFKTIFLTEVFIKLFVIVSPLTEAFHNSNIRGMAFDDNLIDGVLDGLCEEFGNSSYETLWSEACTLYDDLKKNGQKPEVDASTEHLYSWHKTYLDIVKCMKDQIKYRFETARKFNFFRILDSAANDGRWLSPDHVLILNAMYGLDFQLTELTKELKLIASTTPAASLLELHNFFFKCGLKNQLVSVCELLLTLPFTPPTVQVGNFSKLQIVNSRSCTPDQLKTPGDISLLCVEQEYLEEMKKSESFNSRVMHHFQLINKTLELY